MSQPHRRRRKGLIWRGGTGFFDRALLAMAIAGLLGTAASWLGGLSWLLELLTHFRFQFACGATLLLFVSIVRRRPGIASLAAFAAVANMLPIVPYATPGAVHAQPERSALRFLAANVNLRNRDYRAALALIEAEQPDVVALMEVDAAWIGALGDLHDRYPHSFAWPEEGAYGIALFSRYPVRELDGSPYREGGVQTAARVGIDVNEKEVILTLAHMKAPTSPGHAALRNRQIAAIAEMIGRDSGREHILIGDLNTTPWSPQYRPLEETAGLRNAARGRGYSPTWPAGFGLMGIPIDHVLTSGGIEVLQFRRGASFGSDHLPIVADLAVTGSSAGLSR